MVGAIEEFSFHRDIILLYSINGSPADCENNQIIGHGLEVFFYSSLLWYWED